MTAQFDLKVVSKCALAPNGPEKWGCRMRIRDLFSKIRDLFSKFETYAVIRDYETKKTAGAAEPPEPPSLAPMIISIGYSGHKTQDFTLQDLSCKTLVARLARQKFT